MDRTNLPKYADAAWLILDYLSCHPDAKDTIEGVKHWWLTGSHDALNGRNVQGALDELVKADWVLSSERLGTGKVYALNTARRHELLQIILSRPHGQETRSVDWTASED